MSLLEFVRVAVSAILANKVRALLTTLGVVIGVLAVTLLVALGEGARLYLEKEFAGLGSNLLNVHPGKRETEGMGPPLATERKLTLEDAGALARRAVTLDGVSPVVTAGATVRSGLRRRDVLVLGVGDRFSEIRQMRVDAGRFLEAEDVDNHRRIIVLGRVVAEELFGDSNPLGQTVRVADATFRVVGLMERRGRSLGFDLDDLVFLPATTAMDVFGLESINEMILRARDKAGTAAAMADVKDILMRRHGGREDFTVMSQEDLLRTVGNITQTMTGVLLAIASISLIVGGIGIANIMLVSVRERTREIGVRRAVGARRRDVLLQFLVEAIMVSVLGGLIGLGLGATVLAVVRQALPQVPVALTGWIVALALGFSAVVGVIAGVWPAKLAADLDPVEALRYE